MASRISILVILNLCCSMRVTNSAFNTKATFPPKTDYPRLRLTDPLPSLKEFTLCAWVRHDLINGVAASILSYAVELNSNEMSIYSYRKVDDILVRLHVSKDLVDFNCTSVYQSIGKWQHICTTWFGPDGSTNVYINGESCGKTAILSVNALIKGGGVAIIGQEQDALDGNFDSSQAWVGDIAELHMWNEALSDDAIWEAGKCDAIWTNGNVINWLKTPMTAYDGVILSETQLCKS